MKQEPVIITNKLGLHIRSANLLVNTAQRFSSTITLVGEKRSANAKRIMEILLLGAKQGDTLTLAVAGEDESDAFLAVSALIANGFGENP